MGRLHKTVNFLFLAVFIFQQVLCQQYFSEIPTDQSAQVGTTVVFKCAVAHKVGEIQWLKDGFGLGTESNMSGNERYSIFGNVNNGQANLRITDVQPEDGGTYLCMLLATESTPALRSPLARLRVTGPPYFEKRPENKAVVVGQTVTLTCQAKGSPAPAVFWSKDDDQVLMFPRQNHGRISISDDGDLTIDSAQAEDTGTYTCNALNVVGSSLAAAHVQVDVQGPPYFEKRPENKTVVVGQRVTLTCQAKGNPQPAVQWSLGGVRIDQGRFSVSGDGGLTIEDAQIQDTGTYTCTAGNFIGFSSATARLDVQGPPYFEKRPENKTVVVGQRVTLTCQAKGNPQPAVQWSLDGVRVDRGRFSVSRDGSLTIVDAQTQDTGTYTCTASNVIGFFSSATARLDVQGPPYFEKRPENKTVVVGQRVTLTCQAKGNPQPAVQWSLDGRRRFDLGRFTASDDGSLTIVDAQTQDTGTYTCTASNVFGISSATAKLDVQASVDAQDCTTTNAASSLEHAIFAQMNRNPVILQRADSNRTTTTITLKWTSINYGIGYYIKYRPLPSTHLAGQHPNRRSVPFAVHTVTGSQSNTYVLRGLQRGTWYGIKLAPFSGTFEGPESNELRVQTLCQ